MKRSIYALFLVMLLFLGSISFSIAHSTNTIIYVDDDGTADYTSIQAAINAATDGDTIFVYEGTYRETLFIDKSLHLIGENKQKTMINQTDNSNAILISIEHPNVHLEGFTLIDNDQLWTELATVISIASENNIIENNIIRTNLYYAIKLQPETKKNSIQHNFITGDYAAINLDWSWNNHIYNNVFTGQGTGLNAQYSFSNMIQRNHFENDGIGVFLTECNDNNFSQNNFITYGDEVYISPHLSFNTWNSNYWQDYQGKVPFYVVTQRYIPFTNIPLVFWFDIFRIDWNPVSVSYDIDGGIQ